MAFCPRPIGSYSISRTFFANLDDPSTCLVRRPPYANRQMNAADRDRSGEGGEPPWAARSVKVERDGRTVDGSPARKAVIRHRPLLCVSLVAQTFAFHWMLTIALHGRPERKEGTLNKSAILA